MFNIYASCKLILFDCAVVLLIVLNCHPVVSWFMCPGAPSPKKIEFQDKICASIVFCMSLNFIFLRPKSMLSPSGLVLHACASPSLQFVDLQLYLCVFRPKTDDLDLYLRPWPWRMTMTFNYNLDLEPWPWLLILWPWPSSMTLAINTDNWNINYDLDLQPRDFDLYLWP